jgi:hypothetical protein
MIIAAYPHSTLFEATQQGTKNAQVPRRGAFMQVVDFGAGAGERIRTADLPFTRRLLCQLSYTGGRLGAW